MRCKYCIRTVQYAECTFVKGFNLSERDKDKTIFDVAWSDLGGFHALKTERIWHFVEVDSRSELDIESDHIVRDRVCLLQDELFLFKQLGSQLESLRIDRLGGLRCLFANVLDPCFDPFQRHYFSV